MVGRSLFCCPSYKPLLVPAEGDHQCSPHQLDLTPSPQSYIYLAVWSTPKPQETYIPLLPIHVYPTSEVCAMAETQATAPAIDETPISPVREGIQRRNSLEKHLTHRPDVQDLKNRNILLDTNAAP